MHRKSVFMEKKMRKRLLAVLLAIGMVCLPCLSGCSDNVPDSGSYEDQNEEDEDSDEDDENGPR